MDFDSIKLDGLSLKAGADAYSPNIAFEEASHYDIAIIGVGAKLPLAERAADFRELLRSGQDCVRELPADRKRDTDAYFRFKGADPAAVRYGEAAFLEHIDRFDYSFFKLSPKEASLLDPNQRIFLQTAWRALEDSGYGADLLRGSRTGVYLGYGSEGDYKRMIADLEPESVSLSVPGNVRPIIASRLSYLLDLRGPSLVVDTTCSSSLAAVHLACQALRGGECDLALAGGIQLHLIPVREAEVGIESSTARARTFDETSDGTGSGEGAVAMLLKPLARALEDGDSIYAVIKASALNQDGGSVGITAPNAEAQEAVIAEAWRRAGIDPETIGYIEAHGTGTKLGDPIEIEGITRAFRRFTDKKQFCAVGAVKSNIGHLDNAAGIAGLLKAVLSLKHKELYPSLHFERPNRKIAFELSPVYVVDRLTPWESEGRPRRCGVSSFGMSGTNCHVVLEEAPAPWTAAESASGRAEIFVLSAGTEQGLERLIAQYVSFLPAHPELALGDICFTACTGRGHYGHRIALTARDAEELALKLATGAYYASRDVETAEADGSGPDETGEPRDGEKRREPQAGRLGDEASLAALCRRYVRGASIEWSRLYAQQRRRRVHLPAYSFEERRCWLALPAAAGGQAEFGGANESDELGEPDGEAVYYRNIWRRAERQAEVGEREPGGACLIVHDGSGFGERLSAALRAEGGGRTIDALPGAEYAQESDAVYKLPDTPEAIGRLWAGLAGIRIGRVVLLAGLADESDAGTPEQLEERLQRGIYRLCRWVRQMAEARPGQPIELVVVSACGSDAGEGQRTVCPENGALYGLAKAIGWEYPALRVRCIDIDETAEAAAICAELKARRADYMTAYRAGQRYVERLVRARLPAAPGPDAPPAAPGVCLITGGLGELGLQIAASLAADGARALALVQRAGLPPRSQWADLAATGRDRRTIRRIEAIIAIERTGCRVECYEADVADRAQLERALARIRSELGAIGGVVHAAGNMEGNRLAELDESHLQAIVAPKIRGAWLLAHLLRNEPLAFFILFSSAITLMGGIGSGPYTAANAYLNAFSARLGREGRPGLAINWPTWESGEEAAASASANDKELFETLSAPDGIAAFARLRGLRNGQVYAGRLNPRAAILGLKDILPFALDESLTQAVAPAAGPAARPPQGAAAGHALPAVRLKGKSGDTYSGIERKVAAAWVQVLGYEELDVHDNFFELGGDSISMAKAHALIEREFPGRITVADLFSYSSIAKIAEYIAASGQSETDSTQTGAFQAELLHLLERFGRGERTLEQALEEYAAMEVLQHG